MPFQTLILTYTDPNYPDQNWLDLPHFILMNQKVYWFILKLLCTNKVRSQVVLLRDRPNQVKDLKNSCKCYKMFVAVPSFYPWDIIYSETSPYKHLHDNQQTTHCYGILTLSLFKISLHQYNSLSTLLHIHAKKISLQPHGTIK